jgi:dimethylargininase
MAQAYGNHSMWQPLRRVLVRRPDQAFGSAEPQRWHYTAPINLAVAQQEHDALVELVRSRGAEVLYHDQPQPDRADSIFVFDPILMTDEGAVILSMGKDLRRGEESAMAERLERLDIPVLARLEGDARAEGGDMFWLDAKTLAIGLGFRTNAEGVRQIAQAIAPLGAKVLPVELPYYTGPEACLHLLSLLSVLDEDLAVVYPPLMATPFWQELKARGFRMVEVPEQEFLTMGSNVLALGPSDCVMLAGNPITQERLEQAGCTVQTYQGNELSLKAEGGATCLTQPLLRG